MSITKVRGGGSICSRLLIGLLLVFALGVPAAHSYNWSWDQGHDCVKVGGGYGHYDSGGDWVSDPCCYCKASPVFVKSGAYQELFTDLVIPGAGPDLKVMRTYNSNDPSSGMMGYGWSLTFGKRLILVTDPLTGTRRVIIKKPTGQKITFDEQADGSFAVAPGPGVLFSLTHNVDGTYTITEQDGTVQEYNADGKLTTITDRNGNQLNIQYDYSTGCPQAATNAAGRSINITIGPNGKIASIGDYAGRVVQYSYDAAANLTSVIDPLGNTTTYTYDTERRLVSINDPLGNLILSLTYDSQNRVATYMENGETYTMTYQDGRTIKTDSQGNTWTCFFNEYGFVQKEIDPLGNINTRQHNLITSSSLDQESFGVVEGTYTSRSIAYSWTDISSTGAPGPTGDDSYVTANIGFSFPFYDNIYTSLRISSNGYLTFGPYATTYSNRGIPSTYQPNNFIAPYWDDLHPSGGTIRYQTVGTAPNRQFIVQWNNVRYYYSSLRETFQVVLHENSNSIVCSYASTSYGGSSATIGIENAAGTAGLQISYNQAIVSNGTSFEIYQPVVTPPAVYQYTYDSNGNTASVTDPLGNVTSYTYEPNYNMPQTITDALGVVTRFEYDANGNVLREYRAYGTADQILTAYTYDNAGNVLTVTDPAGNVSTNTYDQYGNHTAETDPLGNTTTYAYDQLGNMTSVTDPLGNTTTYSYDVLGQLLGVTDPLGNTTSNSYDAAGNLASSTDANGNTTTYGYDTYGNMTSQTDPLGYSTTYTYDSHGNRTSVTDANGNTTTYVYDALDQKVEQVNANGDTTAYSYDRHGNLTSITDAEGGVSSIEYDLLGRRTSETNAGGQTVQYSYNGLGKLTNAIYLNGDSLSASYSPLGKLVSLQSSSSGPISSFSYDQRGLKLSASDAAGATTYYAYDAAGRQTSLTEPTDGAMSFTYDAAGRVASVETPQGQMASYQYDAAGRKIGITDALGNASSFISDANGNTLSMTDANGNTTSYVYDALNRKTHEYFADGSIRAFTYDGVGRILTTIEPSGDTLAYSYDNMGYTVSIDWPGTVDDASFVYDGLGRMISGTSASGVTEFDYDAVGRLAQSRQFGTVVSYSYIDSSDTREITYPGGMIIREQYSPQGRLTGVFEGFDTLAFYVFGSDDRLSTRILGNGTSTSYRFDTLGHISSVSHSAGGSIILGFDYTHSERGQVTSAAKSHDTLNSFSYQYDAINRLLDYQKGEVDAVGTIASPTEDVSFTLDGVGNWQTKTTDGIDEARVHNALNQCIDVGGSQYSYDADGNLIESPEYFYSYSPANRLMSVVRKSDGLVVAGYVYDPFGRRVSKTAAGITTAYVYDGSRVLEEQVSGETVRSFVWGLYVDEPVAMRDSNGTYFFHADANYNIGAITDSIGAVVERYSYGPYGKLQVTDSIGQPIDVSAIGNSYTFTGRRFDPETGLYFYRMRYYDPDLGRFTTRDPVEAYSGFNLYQYVLSDPVNLLDPNGLEYTKCTSKSWSFNFEDILGWVPKVFKVPVKEVGYERKFCELCCGKGTKHAGDLVTDEQHSLNFVAFSWSSPYIPFWGITIPFHGYVGLVGQFSLSAGGSGYAQTDKCNDGYSGGGCITGGGAFEVQFGANAHNVVGGYIAGRIALSVSACIVVSTTAPHIDLKTQGCVSGSIKLVAILIIKKEWTIIEHNFCTPLFRNP